MEFVSGWTFLKWL